MKTFGANIFLFFACGLVFYFIHSMTASLWIAFAAANALFLIVVLTSALLAFLKTRELRVFLQQHALQSKRGDEQIVVNDFISYEGKAYAAEVNLTDEGASIDGVGVGSWIILWGNVASISLLQSETVTEGQGYVRAKLFLKGDGTNTEAIGIPWDQSFEQAIPETILVRERI